MKAKIIVLFLFLGFVNHNIYSQKSMSELDSIKQKYDGLKVIALADLTANKFPFGEEKISVALHSIWKCNVLYLPSKKVMYTDKNDSTIIYQLSNGQDTIIAYNDSRDGYLTIKPMFDLYSLYLKDKNKDERDNEKLRNSNRRNLVKKYGEKYGSLIFQEKVIIGMTKNMCEESWGLPNSSRVVTSKSGSSEVCRYSKGTLVFVNGKVTKIVVQ